MAMEIAMDSTISFANSQYDTHASSRRQHTGPSSSREISAKA